MRILLIVAAILLLCTSLALAVSVDSVLVFDADDLPGSYKGSLLKGISIDGGSTYPFSDDFTVSCSSVDAQEYYTLLMVKASVNGSGGLDAAYEITEDNILYIDQKLSGADGSISFEVRPSSVESSVFLLGGSFDQSGLSSPILLGAMDLGGVSVSGTVALQGRTSGKLDQVTVTLSPSSGVPLTFSTDTAGSFGFSGIPQGTYRLKAEKPGYLSYEKLSLAVSVEAILETISLIGGDIVTDGHVNIDDLGVLLSQYHTNSTDAYDIDGNGHINIDDLGILLSNYHKTRAVEY